MVVIELQGNPGAGKSTTMRILYSLLLQAGFVRSGDALEHPWNDFAVLLERNSRRYGFMTFGDVLRDQRHLLNEFEVTHRCAIVLCASRLFSSWRIQDHYAGGPPLWKNLAPVGSRALEILEENTRDAMTLYERLVHFDALIP